MSGMAFFSVVSWAGLTVPAVLRIVRRWLVGPVRKAVPEWKTRRLV
jgi:intracellular multiplication protein IcmT